MAFPEKEPSAAPAAPASAPAAAPAAPAAPEAGMAEIGGALKHIATLLETVLTRLPGAEPAAAPAATAAAPGAEDESGPDAPDGPGPDLALEPTARIEGAADEDEPDGGNPELPPSNQAGTPARGEPTPHGAMDSKTVKAMLDAAVLGERQRAARVEEARRATRNVLGEVTMDDAGAIYREALAQVGVDVSLVEKGTEHLAWNAYKAAAGAAAGVSRKSTTALAMDGKAGEGADQAPSYLKHLDSISVKG